MEKFFGWVAALILGGAVYHSLRADQPGAIGSPSTTVATTSSAANEDPPPSAAATWTTVDLFDIVVDLPGQPTSRSSVETTQAGSMTAHWREAKRGETLHVWTCTLDPVVAPYSWNATAAVDMSAEYAIAGVRGGPDAASVRTTKSERHYVAGMVGREIEIHVTPKVASDPRVTMRAIYLSRTNRVYQITVASAETDPRAESDAAEIIRSVRRGPRSTVGLSPPAPTMIKPPPDGVTPEDLAGIANTMQNESAQVGTITPQPANDPAPVDPVLYGYGAGSNPVPEYHGPVHVNGYVRRDGTYVQPHTRSAPRR